MIEYNGKVYFTADELRCKGSGGLKLAPDFDKHLLSLRLKFNRPMNVLSCCRSTEHNKYVRGGQHSFHIYDKPDNIGTCAIDIATPTPEYRTALVKLALQEGWSVGIKRTMVHLDYRTAYYPTYPQVVFVY